jgi:hypothetical protein
MINNILNGDVADVRVRVQYWYSTLTFGFSGQWPFETIIDVELM